MTRTKKQSYKGDGKSVSDYLRLVSHSLLNQIGFGFVISIMFFPEINAVGSERKPYEQL